MLINKSNVVESKRSSLLATHSSVIKNEPLFVKVIISIKGKHDLKIEFEDTRTFGFVLHKVNAIMRLTPNSEGEYFPFTKVKSATVGQNHSL